MQKATLGLLACTALILAGCGTDPGERAVGPALEWCQRAERLLLALLGAIPALVRARSGAVAGGVVGATTSPCDVDLNARDGRRDCGRDDRYRDRVSATADRQGLIVNARGFRAPFSYLRRLNNPCGPVRSLMNNSLTVTSSLAGVRPKPTPVSMEIGSPV